MLALILAAALIPVEAIISGFAFKVSWTWFVVATFGVAPLTIPQALGLALMVSYATYHPPGKKSPKDAEEFSALEVVAGGFLRSGFMLLIGYVYHCFM